METTQLYQMPVAAIPAHIHVIIPGAANTAIAYRVIKVFAIVAHTSLIYRCRKYKEAGYQIICMLLNRTIAKIWQYARVYDAYRRYILAADWYEVTKEESLFVESGTILNVIAHHKSYKLAKVSR